MNDAASLVTALATGVLLGVIFFGGLWWTIRKGLASAHAALWFFGSLLLRTSVVLAGFYLVASDSWRTLLACLVGFVTARLAVTWITRLPRPSGSAQAPEGSHAP